MKTKRTIKLFLIIIMLLAIFKMNTAQAALQANQNSASSKSRNTWMVEIRKMESLGGTLGLTETQNGDLTFNGTSNDIDIHLQKNTEYGAMALLSASSYGKSDKIQNGQTTTGNETGVVIPFNSEWVAAQFTDYYTSKASYADRYLNYYHQTNTPRRAGDAMLETRNWHGTSSVWVADQHDGYANPYGVFRGLGQGIFAFNNQGTSNQGWYVKPTVAHIDRSYTARAVIVNGQGL